jgi:hypothetical protein
MNPTTKWVVFYHHQVHRASVLSFVPAKIRVLRTVLGVPIHVINFALVLKSFVANGCRCSNEDSMNETDLCHKHTYPDPCWQKADAKPVLGFF